MPPNLIQEGPTANNPIMLIAEAPGAEEAARGRPFVGSSGYELDQELGLAGIPRQSLFITNVCHERPPGNDINDFFLNKTQSKGAPDLSHLPVKAVLANNLLGSRDYCRFYGRSPKLPVLCGLHQLQSDIDRIAPRLIIAMGNTALWALTGETGITQRRGSIMLAEGGPVTAPGTKVIPTLHPAAVLRTYNWKTIVVQDLRRAKHEATFPEVRKPAWNCTVPSTVNDVIDWVERYVNPLDPDQPITSDVENEYVTDKVHDGRLICLGLAADKTNAICIPFVHRVGDNPHYWPSAAAERDVLMICKEVLTTRPITFHNGVHDCQIIAGNYGFMPNIKHDTMIAQHIAYPAQLGGKIDPLTGKTSKSGSSYSLLFCSSMYCQYHRYWKDDGRGWDPTIHDEMQYWLYNCEDCLRTHECREVLEGILKRDALWEQYLFYMSLFTETFEMMFDGLAYDNKARMKARFEVKRQISEVQAWIDTAVGHPLNTGSAPQMMALFYQDYGIPPFLHRKTRKPTLDDTALEKIKTRYKALTPLVERIQGLRSLEVFKQNFLDMRLSKFDKRLRSAINIAGPETMRFSMNTTAFGEGGNLQNLPRDE